MAAQRVKLPNLLHAWPRERRLSPHYETAAAECQKWARELNLFDLRSQHAFDMCDFRELLNLTFAP